MKQKFKSIRKNIGNTNLNENTVLQKRTPKFYIEDWNPGFLFPRPEFSLPYLIKYVLKIKSNKIYNIKTMLNYFFLWKSVWEAWKETPGPEGKYQIYYQLVKELVNRDLEF